jgi:uncharacterized protein (TIGR03083 family)
VPTIVDGNATTTLLSEEFAAISSFGQTLSESDWDAPTCLPGWKVRDNLGHMIGTESMLLQLPAPEIEVGEPTHVRNAIGQANEVWVSSMRALPGAEVLARFEDITDRRIAVLRNMTQADFDAPSWTPAGPNETYGRFMRIRHFDCFMHEHDMRTALGATDRPDPTHVASALDEVATGLGFIVGKRAQAPEGARVRIELTGPAARQLLVEVAERAAVVNELSAAPTVTVQLPSMLFLRLTGGRQAGGPHIGQDVTVEGDSEFGRRLVENFAFTI